MRPFQIFTLKPTSCRVSISVCRCGSDISVSGRRSLPQSLPVSLSAVLTGMGFVSMNRSENSFAYLKYLYIEKKLRQDDQLAQYHTLDLYYKKQEELLNSLTEKDIDIFLDEITECDLRTSNYKDLACGDCLSLGINIRYKF